MEPRLREAVLSLASSPGWYVYQEFLSELVRAWGEEALTPGLSYDETEALRQARIRVETSILSLPDDARREQEEANGTKR